MQADPSHLIQTVLLPYIAMLVSFCLSLCAGIIFSIPNFTYLVALFLHSLSTGTGLVYLTPLLYTTEGIML